MAYSPETTEVVGILKVLESYRDDIQQIGQTLARVEAKLENVETLGKERVQRFEIERDRLDYRISNMGERIEKVEGASSRQDEKIENRINTLDTAINNLKEWKAGIVVEAKNTAKMQALKMSTVIAIILIIVRMVFNNYFSG